ncbi:MAG TPA: glycosyltransferase, partial [Chitinophagaceae bacterium]
MELHTFVIPVYKKSPFLEECILSLKEQTSSSLIIITTSTPTDYSRDLALKYNILYLVNDKMDAGIAEDWNFALAQAPSRFVTLAHQDNLYERTYTETVLNALAGQDHLSPILAFTGYSDLIGDKLRARSLNHLVKNVLLLPFHLKPAIQFKSI